MVQHHLFKYIALVNFLLVAMVSGVPLMIRDAMKPSSDPFYVPEAGFENAKPGDILKSRALPPKSLAAFSAFSQNINGVYQYLYRSTDALGNPTATVTTLMVPKNADPTKLGKDACFLNDS